LTRCRQLARATEKSREKDVALEPNLFRSRGCQFKSGSVLLKPFGISDGKSHIYILRYAICNSEPREDKGDRIVPSAREGLTAEFGQHEKVLPMITGRNKDC
jgi:hypothetical protein